MSVLSKKAVDIFAPVQADGVPRSVSNLDAQVWGTELERLIDGVLAVGGKIYPSKSLMDADLSPTANTPALVIGDPNSANNGLYRKIGGSGSGSWQRIGDVPGYQIIPLTNTGAGTNNVLRATSALPIPLEDRASIMLLNVVAENTGPVSLVVNSDIVRGVKSNSGREIEAGYLRAGMVLALVSEGAYFRLISDVASAAIQEAAEAARVAAEAARDLAANYANDALDGGMDPGLSTFTAISGLEVPAGILRFTTGGYSVVADGGGGLVKLAASGPATAYRSQSADGQWWELAENVPTLEMFGAKGDGITDDTAARNDAIAYVGINGRINLLDGKTYLVADNANASGVSFEGNGQLVTSVTGGLWQRNTYADEKQLHIGGEYLKRAYDYIRLSQGGTSGTLDVHVFGDSTVAEDTSGTGERPDVCITQAFQRIGIPNIFVQNQGVSGSKWRDDVYPSGKSADYVTATSGLFVYKYLINDAGFGFQDTILRMREELSDVRSREHGSLEEQSIIVMLGNSTFDSPNGRDARWFESIRPAVVAVCREFHCAMFDSYAILQDSSLAAGKWMDDPFGDGRAVHPTGVMNRWIYGELIRTFFEGKVDDARTNHFFNEGNVSTVLASNTAPSAFKYGYYHNRAIIANGWPFDGFVITEKNVDQGTLQTFYGYSNDAPRVLRRRAVIGTDTWTGWTGTPVAISLSNGWANQGDPWDIPTATPTDDGFVILSGLVNSGTTTSGTVMGTLPAGVRPVKDHVFTVAANGGFVRISVHVDGTIKAMGTVDGTWTSFDGVLFRAA